MTITTIKKAVEIEVMMINSKSEQSHEQFFGACSSLFGSLEELTRFS
jgi:hypothetical protein